MKYNKCIAHKWGYHDIPEQGLRFRVCEKCDCLEAKFVKIVNDKWRRYTPHGGIGFINALKDKIAREKEKQMLTNGDVESVVEEMGNGVENKEV